MEQVLKTSLAEIRSSTGLDPDVAYFTFDFGVPGMWEIDQNDNTSADNTGTILITADGKRLKRRFAGSLNVKYFGVQGTTDLAGNKMKIQQAVDWLSENGGGVILIPQDVEYGYKRNTIASQIDLSNLAYDILIEDHSVGDSHVLPKRDGVQTRYFYGQSGNVADGQHDGQGQWIRGSWHPYLMISNDKNPLEATRRHATVFFAVNGVAYWGIGQGAFGNPNTGTNRDDEMADFKIAANKLEGNDNLTNVMLIENKTGRFGFNCIPQSDYHFNTLRNNAASINGAITFENPKGGAITLLLKTQTSSRAITLEETGNTGDIRISNAANTSIVFRIKDNGAIQIGGGTEGIYVGNNNPEGTVSAGEGSIYIRKDPAAPNQALFVKSAGSGNTGWLSLRGVQSGNTRPSSTGLIAGCQFFDTSLNRPIWWSGAGWVDASGNIV